MKPASLKNGRDHHLIRGRAPVTFFLKHGDRGRIRMEIAGGHPIFGVVDQQVDRDKFRQ